jgi:hypothetical protein
MRRTCVGCLLLALSLLVLSPSRAPAADTSAAGPPRELWLYYPTNLMVEKNIDKLEEIWTRAAKAGYTHVLLGDSKFNRLKEMPAGYFKNVERTKQIAKKLNLTIVPAVFSVGYSNDLLSNDPNLAEGLPVKDSLFVVKGGAARLVAEPEVRLGKVGFHDENVVMEGDTATVKPGGGGVARFNYPLKVPQFRCYHVSVRIKTEDYHGQPEVKALAGKRSLQWENLHVRPTQDWTEHHVVFNTLDNAQVTLYFGDWSHPKTGSLQWKDWRIEEVGLLNVLRRPGAPVTVKGEDGRVYEEGKDYEPIKDPHMGNDPYAGEYKSWHEPPVIRTRLADGTRLRVSWYHPAIIYDGQVSACISEPATMRLLADQAKRMKELFGAPGYMMSHDEFRTLGWDDSCEKTHKTPGQLLAENVRQCRELLKGQKAYVWNDMFDPYHNAVEGPYYLVNGPWTGSWEGLSKDVVIVNWNYGKRDESLKFFADRGNQQVIAGYYDGGQDTKKWLESAGKVKGVIGIMYTTWRNDYSRMEGFAKEAVGSGQ